jgi:trehalose 6-phosphate phosphatase
VHIGATIRDGLPGPRASVRGWLGRMDLSPEAEMRYDAVVGVARQAVVGLDFDGTLSPIVDDPTAAVIHPDAPGALVDIAAKVRAVAIITGRPAAQVVELGRLDSVADALPSGARLLVRGQYGHEHWDSDTRTVSTPPVPRGLAAFHQELPELLAGASAADAFVEEKGLALAVHTRRLPDPAEAFARLEEPLADAAERHGLVLEPGRLVLEVRAAGSHKGHALRQVVADTDAGAVVFAGDDLGDLEAFEAARSFRDQGLPVLLVCSGSAEEQALAELADLVVDGPDGMVELLRRIGYDAAPPG